ncbi:hypothetical protein BZM26_29270 [Paraburkholderia strydomiana]|nr:hypothetical protein BZM26_29270 [Paraburkholderia strydomiana]
MNLLAERQREVLTRAFVISQVWDMSFDSGTNIVEVAIGRMRAKIDDPFERKASAHSPWHGLCAEGQIVTGAGAPIRS